MFLEKVDKKFVTRKYVENICNQLWLPESRESTGSQWILEIGLKKLINFPVVMAKVNLKIGIIHQCYIYFRDQNIMIYIIHKSMFCNTQITPHIGHYHINQYFVTVKSPLIWIISYKSVFWNTQITPYMDHYCINQYFVTVKSLLINSIFDSFMVQLETWFNI